MIYNQELNYDKIKIHKKQDHLNGYTFVPIKYDNKDFVIQTPKLFIPFNISTFNNKRYLDLSFQNIKNDKNIKLLINNLDLIHEKIKDNIKKYKIRGFLKENHMKNLQMRFKVLDNTLFFDHNKQAINNIENLTYGTFIIHLHGLWIINGLVTFEWILLQGKIDMPLYLSEYAFVDENRFVYKDIHDNGKGSQGKGKGKGKGIPPPPPLNLNNNVNKLLKMGISKEAIDHKMKMESVPFNPKDLLNVSLKKTVVQKKVTKENELLLELKQFLKEKNKV